jgi:hypothetical protein
MTAPHIQDISTAIAELSFPSHDGKWGIDTMKISFDVVSDLIDKNPNAWRQSSESQNSRTLIRSTNFRSQRSIDGTEYRIWL